MSQIYYFDITTYNQELTILIKYGNMEQMREEYLSIIEFSKKLHVHPNTIRRLIKKGRIQALKLCSGKKCTYRIAESEVGRIAMFDLEDMIEKIIENRESKNDLG